MQLNVAQNIFTLPWLHIRCRIPLSVGQCNAWGKQMIHYMTWLVSIIYQMHLYSGQDIKTNLESCEMLLSWQGACFQGLCSHSLHGRRALPLYSEDKDSSFHIVFSVEMCYMFQNKLLNWKVILKSQIIPTDLLYWPSLFYWWCIPKPTSLLSPLVIICVSHCMKNQHTPWNLGLWWNSA
jgi:hypothetical protein